MEGVQSSGDLLSVAEVADYLGVGEVTVWRWCREDRLPCLKIGRSWRVRREALEEFLRSGERPSTLVGQLRSFVDVPDNLLVIAQSLEFMHDFDVAFFQMAEARGGSMVKYRVGDEGYPVELKSEFEDRGLEVSRLEEAGRFQFLTDPGYFDGRPREIRRLASEASYGGRSLWLNFNWEEGIDLEASLRQQSALTGQVEDSGIVIATSVLEEILDDWPAATQRRAQVLHAGTIWLSEAGLSLSRVLPLSSGSLAGPSDRNEPGRGGV